jgi:opacity protein-like surface antigen
MKRFTFALLASLAALPAFAADLPLPTKAPVPLSAIAGSGFYIGINGGAAGSGESYNFITAPGTAAAAPSPFAPGKVYPAGAMTGLTVGFGGTLGGVYAALESDFDYDFTRGQSACGFGGVMTMCGANNSWLFTQRVVLGLPLSSLSGVASKIPTSAASPSQWPVPISLPTNISVGNLMPFVTAGIAERNVSAFVTGYGNGQEWLVGYDVGGGLRMPLASGWSAKVQYDYIGFNKSFVPASTTVGLFPTTATFKAINEERLIAGLDYHF